MALTLHHLHRSRSTRVLWMLGELGLPFTLIDYPRTAEHRAPAALKAVHPLGKSPVLVDGELTLAESSAILRYLDHKYADGKFSPTPGSADAALHDEWLDYAEGSVAQFVMVSLLGLLTGGLPETMAGIARQELGTHFSHISGRIASRPFLMGDTLMLADIQMSYTLELARDAKLLGGFPDVAAYLERLRAQPGYRAAITRGGPVSIDLP